MIEYPCTLEPRFYFFQSVLASARVQRTGFFLEDAMPRGIYPHKSLSEETKRKLSELSKGKPFSGIPYYKLGIKRKHSEETKEKMRQAKLKNPVRYWAGKKRPEIKNEWRKGLKFTPEQIKNHSEMAKRHGFGKWMKGRKMTEKMKQILSNTNIGRKMTDYQKQRLAEGNKNKIYTEEMRKKMSDSRKGDKSHFWKGGITQLNLILRKSLEYKLWRESV